MDTPATPPGGSPPEVPGGSGPIEPDVRSGSFQRPADYYATPAPPAGRSGCPKWVPITCGVLSLFALLLIFGGGYLILRGGKEKLLGFAFSTMQRQVDHIYAGDVTPQQRDAIRREFVRLNANVRADKVKLPAVQNVLNEVRSDTQDNVVTADEAGRLLDLLQRVNDEAVPTTP